MIASASDIPFIEATWILRLGRIRGDGMRSVRRPGPSFQLAAWHSLLSALLMILYPIVWECCWNGRTLGYWMLNLRVLDRDGLNMDFSPDALHNLMRVLDFFSALYLFGGIVMMCVERFLRLGDIFAGVFVVHGPSIIKHDLDQIGPVRFNSLQKNAPPMCKITQKDIA